ncbi:MAG TPA: RnfABCDGE type electron transport complex subunit G [Candidatus Blautia merdavium]|uniref:Ion-translocating oxidoreductase complex subunit G n=1 Tax=Candidatus Blautia merdavium TaxID=2838494 RepID=A0A9D2PQV5_9FIRM|nr:RnfABCDGE type electron transport complex subunit G [Candidatus Blautia merdavium]
MKKNTILKDTLILTVITLVAGGLLGLVYEITKEPIAQQEELAKQEAYQAVFEDADSFEVCVEAEDAEIAAYLAENGFTAQTVNEIMEAKDASGETLGYAINMTTSEGYGGDISFSMGVQMDGTMNGISILSINETAGLGMNAQKDEFKNQYSNKNVEAFEVTKTGASGDDQINAISGATITSNAVTGGVNAGLCAFNYVKEGN